MTRRKRPVRVLCASGLDPTGRAGLLADASAVTALGGQALGVALSLTAQGGKTFLSVGVPTSTVQAQLSGLLEAGGFEAVKVGAIPGPGALDALVELLSEQGRIPWVVDPVMFTSSGERLSKVRGKDYFLLAGKNVVLTPNVLEAARLTGDPPAQSTTEAAAQGARLLAKGFRAVVVKGGHLPGPAVDVVCTPKETVLLPAKRVAKGAEARGTGCRFASALALYLAQGEEMRRAAASAKAFVDSYLRAR